MSIKQLTINAKLKLILLLVTDLVYRICRPPAAPKRLESRGETTLVSQDQQTPQELRPRVVFMELEGEGKRTKKSPPLIVKERSEWLLKRLRR